jgi:DNA-binding MarR family transcriptional regulator
VTGAAVGFVHLARTRGLESRSTSNNLTPKYLTDILGRVTGKQQTAEGQPCAASSGRAGDGGWVWGDEGAEVPPDAPLYALFSVAVRSMHAFWSQAAQGTGVSPAGLGILRVLTARDGLKSSEVAARGWSTPATVTSVVDTLERDGYVERRRDEEDRRVVRLFVTDAGRRKCDEALTVVVPRLGRCVGSVDPMDEPVIRKFLVDTIMRFGELIREERK